MNGVDETVSSRGRDGVEIDGHGEGDDGRAG